MNASTVSAYMIGFVVFAVCMLLAVIIASSIKYEAGVNPQDKKKRRLWFWIMAVACPLLIIAVNYFSVYTGIKIPSKRAAYMLAMGISSGVFFVLYILLGFLLSKVAFKHGKLSSWF
ncbi:MAG: hypothetical protein ACI350_08320 [Prevotella sp.]